MNPLLKSPSSDFNAIRDGRNSLPLYIDVDLSGARSISANTQLILNIAGNSFYSDADTTSGGNATIHFQDTNLGISAAPFFVSPGFIANVGFTQLLIENTAQAGKRIRIFYGVDIDFQAGVNSSIAIAGTVSVSNTTQALKIAMYQAGNDYTGSYQSGVAMAANTPDIIVAPAANINGLIVVSANIVTNNVGGYPFPAILAKASAPVNNTDGDVIMLPDCYTGAGGGAGSLKIPIKVPAGKGLYYITSFAEVSAHRQVKYILL